MSGPQQKNATLSDSRTRRLRSRMLNLLTGIAHLVIQAARQIVVRSRWESGDGSHVQQLFERRLLTEEMRVQQTLVSEMSLLKQCKENHRRRDSPAMPHLEPCPSLRSR